MSNKIQRGKIYKFYGERNKTMVKYFVCITTWQNYNICEKNNLWGVEEHRVDDLRKSSKGDVFIFYLKEVSPGAGGISGSIFERESETDFEEIKQLWGDGLYPYRVKIKLLDDSTRHKRFHAKGCVCAHKAISFPDTAKSLAAWD